MKTKIFHRFAVVVSMLVLALGFTQCTQVGNSDLVGFWEAGEGCDVFQFVFNEDGTFYMLENSNGRMVYLSGMQPGSFASSDGTTTFRYKIGGRYREQQNRFEKKGENQLVRVNLGWTQDNQPQAKLPNVTFTRCNTEEARREAAYRKFVARIDRLILLFNDIGKSAHDCPLAAKYLVGATQVLSDFVDSLPALANLKKERVEPQAERFKLALSPQQLQATSRACARDPNYQAAALVFAINLIQVAEKFKKMGK